MPNLDQTGQNQPLLPEEIPHFGTKWSFVGIDLAPNDSLETGVAVLDRNRTLIRTDKLYTNKDLLLFLKSLGPLNNLIVSLDVPKSLSISGKWRQEEVKMHPLRLIRQDGEVIERYAKRAKDIYTLLAQEGIYTLLYLNYEAKMKYDLFVPFRSRTPQGCRTLQAAIKNNLQIPNVPVNLAPSSVLDAMVGAYISWSVYKGKAGTHFELARDHQERIHCTPLQRIKLRRR